MGSFYTSHTVHGPAQAQILDWLQDRPAYVSSTTDNAITIVLDEASESQDPAELAGLASGLSARFNCPVLALLNHDDDVLYFELYENGKKTDQYNSTPDFMGEEPDEDEAGDEAGGDGRTPPSGGDATRLAAAFGGDAAAVEAALRGTGFVLQVERHKALATALNIPGFAIGIGYHYAAAKDYPDDVPPETYVHTGESDA
jgi:hypothetical protein